MPSRATTDYGKPLSHALWFDIVPRSAACPELPARVLLHAGPPFRGAPPAPVTNCAIQALLFEGLAPDIAAARALLARGEIKLRPAQDYSIVTPLAQVISASMLMVAVKQQNRVFYAPIVEGPAPALRFGSMAGSCLHRLRDIGTWMVKKVAPIVRREPLAVDEVIRTALAAGEECHARTAVANNALISRLTGLDADCGALLRANPAFVLPIFMAAAAAALQSRRCGIEAIGGNGIDFGVKHRGAEAWLCLPASAPQGLRFTDLDALVALPAIGDSGVIDFCGLGGQALAAAPQVAAEWSGTLPADALSRRQSLVDPNTGVVDPARVVRSGLSPLINLSILDRDGTAGLIGRGFYLPPVSLFAPLKGAGA
jgi:hypothetical protein